MASQLIPGYSQNYIPLLDASGVEFSTLELNQLEDHSVKAINTLPESFRSTFKIYDFQFYLLNENFEGGTETTWELAKSDVDARTESDSYMLFGREINPQSLNVILNVELKLPQGQPFDCLDAEKRNNIEKYIQASANQKLKESGVHAAEILALRLLDIYLYKIIECECTGIREGCSLETDFLLIDSELLGLGFRKKEIKVGGNCTWTNGTQGIYDYFGKEVEIDVQYYCIADQLSEGKAILDSAVQVLPDTSIATSIIGKVYILDGESFSNNEWENAKSASGSNDYVEYWVILQNIYTNQYYLYSRYTIGPLEVPVSFGDETPEERNSRLSASPWILALKVLGNAALDACFQAAVIRLIDENVHSWTDAWAEVSYLGALWEGVSSIIPWKKDIKTQILKTAVSALAVVIENGLNDPNYTEEEGITDFIVGFAASGLVQLATHPKAVNAGKYAFRKGMGRLYGQLPSNSPLMKNVINTGLGSVGGENPGAILGIVNKIDLPESTLLQAEVELVETVKELVATGNYNPAGKKFWIQHEENITNHLASTFGSINVGSQLYFTVYKIDGTSFEIRCDNLIKHEGKLILCEGKSSIKVDLSKMAVGDIASKLSTENQFKLIKGLQNNEIQRIIPKGPNASTFIGNSDDILHKLTKEITYYINDYALQGYGIYNKTLKL